MSFGDQVLQYHFGLHPKMVLPEGVSWLLPYLDPETRKCMEQFYHQYYQDSTPRHFILGINPGRFGGGLTGIPFTDPIRLAHIGIQNSFPKKQELSSVFIYEMTDVLGGPKKFYQRFYITSLSPLGLLKDGKNYNYYDDRGLFNIIEPFIIRHIRTQLTFGCHRDVVYCLGQGKNFDYLQKLNDQHHWWDSVVPLPHPRWIMQYRLKEKKKFLDLYREALGEG